MSTPPLAGAPASILARTEAPPAPMMAEQVFQRLLRHRIVVLGQQVDDDLANRVCAELILLAAEDGQRDISLYINSPGGSVSAGLAIYDVMQFVPNDVAHLRDGHGRLDGPVPAVRRARTASGTRCRTRRSCCTSRTAASAAPRPTSASRPGRS